MTDRDEDITRAMAPCIDELARCARFGDSSARDALWTAFASKLHRTTWQLWVPSAHRGMTGLWGREEVGQEAWLVVMKMVTRWKGDAGFAWYVFGVFPLRLRSTVYRKLARTAVPAGEEVTPIFPFEY